jgi:DNA-binding SARP family transcriptional activator/Tfp pilus assembly protein PilF
MTDTGSLEFRVLGPVEVRRPGQRIDIGHARQRAVLAVLILELGRVVPTEQLIDRIWGHEPPATVRNVVYSYVARLKAAFADAAEPAAQLGRRAGGYVLEAPPGQCDLYRFRAMVAAAAVAGGDDQAGALLRGAVSLWRGPALAGLGGAWLEGMRDSLELERRAALMNLNDLALRQGQHRALISELSEAAIAQPADERLIGQLMLALYRSGRQADALQWFEQTRRRLADDFGADPGPELQALHRQILRLDPALAAPVPDAVVTPVGGERAAASRAGQATADSAPAPRELPADIPAFTGRAAELAELDRLLVSATSDATAPDPASAVIISAVSGTAGVGKTALAVRWAHQSARHFPDGQLYVNLRGYDPGQPVPAADALAAFLRALGVAGQDVPADAEERAARYRTLMAGRRMLVLLDNASEAEQVRPLLPGAPGCRVLVTSRDALAGLVARDGAGRLDLDLLPKRDAICLLRTLIGPRVDADPDAAAALAAQCARLPLALRVAAELAAGRPQSPLAELASELANQQRRLELLDAGGDPRAAVRAVFSWSYRNLDPAAAATFRLLGCDPGPDLDSCAVAALTGTTQEQATPVLTRLARAHLIQPAGPGRYGMHDLLRAYARDLAAGHDSEDQCRAALTRLLDYYLHTTTIAASVLFPAQQVAVPRLVTGSPPLPDHAAACAWLDAHLASLASAVTYAAGHGWPSHATQLATHLYWYLDAGGRYDQATAIHGSARSAAREAGDHAAEANALIDLATVTMRRGLWQPGVELLRQALALAREAGNLQCQARAVGNLAIAETFQGHLVQSGVHHEQALAFHRQSGNRFGEARTLIGIGSNERLQGRYDLAAAHYQQALALAREQGDRLGEALVLANLADVEFQLGRPDQARDLYQRVLAGCRETGNRISEAYALIGLGKVALRQNRFQEAADLAQRGLAFCRQAGDRNGEAEALNDLGEILLATGQPQSARTRYEAALELADQDGHCYEQARAHNGLGCCCQATANAAQARDHWQQAVALYSRFGAPEAGKIRARLGACTPRHSPARSLLAVEG